MKQKTNRLSKTATLCKKQRAVTKDKKFRITHKSHHWMALCFVIICKNATTGWGFSVVEQNRLLKMLGNAICFVELYCFLRHGVGVCEKM